MAITQPGISDDTLRSIGIPARIESRIGVLEFEDGAPSAETADLLYDHLDFIRGVEAFQHAFPAASLEAIRNGFRSIGVEDDSVLIFSELMDSASVFLTANCDTVYFLSFIDLSDGPKVVDVPPLGAPSGILGTIDDMWFRWITDFGVPGPDRGEGGRYLIVGPGYDGPLPDGGFHVGHCRTTRAIVLGRAFMIDGDPAPAVEAIRDGLRFSTYVPGSSGTAVASFLAGHAPLAKAPDAAATKFVEGTGRSFNTVPPSDGSYWDLVDDFIQREPVDSGDPEILGLLAHIGIAKGKPFAPDARMRRILDEAALVGQATARTVSFAARPEEGFAYYPDSHWYNMLFVGGYEFLTPPPRITAAGVVQSPKEGARKLDSRTAFFYPATGITPAMCMYLTGIGSQYLMVTRGSDGAYLDGARDYKVTLPPNVPQSRFWSLILYDRQTRSMLQTDQRYPDLSSQKGTVVENADGSIDLYFGPTAPAGKEQNWLQTVPGKGWWAILRLYSPETAYFDKTWRPSEVKPV